MKTKYFLVYNQIVGKMTNKGSFLFQDLKWVEDFNSLICNGLLGYDPSEDPTHMAGNTDIIDTIEEISKEEANEIINALMHKEKPSIIDGPYSSDIKWMYSRLNATYKHDAKCLYYAKCLDSTSNEPEVNDFFYLLIGPLLYMYDGSVLIINKPCFNYGEIRSSMGPSLIPANSDTKIPSEVMANVNDYVSKNLKVLKENDKKYLSKLKTKLSQNISFDNYFFDKQGSGAYINRPLDCTEENIEYVLSKREEDKKYSKDDELLCEALRKYPLNVNYIDVAYKITLIDMLNSTNLSKQLKKTTLLEMAKKLVLIKDIDERLKKGDPSLVGEISSLVNGAKLMSFATKYCFYHNRYVYGSDDYSIYDSVVKKTLPYYARRVCIDINMNTIEGWMKTNKYEKFNDCIKEVMTRFRVFNRDTPRYDFDTFLWYENK